MTHAADLTDAEVFGRWYADHWSQAVLHALRITGDVALAEDIAADALARAWQRWQRAGQPERPWGYVTRSIHNLAVSHFRRAHRQRRCLQRLDPPLEPSPEATLADRELVGRLLRRLPASERAAMALHYLDDLSCAEIAERLSVRPVTVRSRLHRARGRLAAERSGLR